MVAGGEPRTKETDAEECWQGRPADKQDQKFPEKNSLKRRDLPLLSFLPRHRHHACVSETTKFKKNTLSSIKRQYSLHHAGTFPPMNGLNCNTMPGYPASVEYRVEVEVCLGN